MFDGLVVSESLCDLLYLYLHSGNFNQTFLIKYSEPCAVPLETKSHIDV